ncbi:MAG TPA: DegT/DnrJ/EryC1/StrS family aminotransferase [Anaerolineae bacterium]|nr:DegT/DnrJ/EryC1/StrS family aminotransferase [Anaerolineae bacterium]
MPSAQPTRRARTFLRHVPPVAVPVHAADLRNGWSALLRRAGAVEQLSTDLKAWTGSSYCGLVSSGRSALAAILLALKRTSKRTKVAVPAYGCPTVVQSILFAGLEPVLCDVSPRTLDLDPDALDRLRKDDLLAVVPTHLYGLAHDITGLLSMGREHGFAVVEDAAQAFGARSQGKMVGTRGDAGFYSLGRGKCLPVGHGGVIAAGERLGVAIEEELRRTPGSGQGASSPFGSLALFLGYGLATNPVGWWFVVRTFLNPASEGMDLHALPPIRLCRLPAVQAAIGRSILGRLGRLQQVWRDNAARLSGMLAEVDGVQVPEIAPGSEPVYLRLPFVTGSRERADALYDRLWNEGIGASRSYIRSLPDLYSEQLRIDPSAFPGAATLANCLLTLPTHSYLREDDFARIQQALRAMSPGHSLG